MENDALIDTLSDELRPVRRHAIARTIAPGLLVGLAVTMVLIVALLGIRPDLDVAARGVAFWMKSAYTSALGLGALLLVAQLARPDTRHLRWLWLPAVPIGLLALAALAELVAAPAADRRAMWLGHSWQQCPWLVLILSAPIFAGLLRSLRRLAPTRPRAAGAAAGLAAGALAATLYGLYCTEASAAFVMTWYSLGIALAAGVGALLGPHALRW